MKFSAAVFLLSCSGAFSADPVDFNRDIRPILAENCVLCHGPDKQKGGLRLDVRAEAVKELKSGSHAIVPRQPDASELLARLTSTDGDERMPPKGDALAPAQIARLREWIAAGADYQVHWAYQQPVRAALPAVGDATWPRNAIDRFVLARLDQERLKPAPGAAWPTLARRLHIDLTGLPPTPAEVDAFAQAATRDAPVAVAALADELMRRPQFGEHWARHWLDLARYADSNGYQHDDLRSVWLYRDWVVRALNADLPFDQFTIEQLAGDLLPQATPEQRIATGFLRCAPVDCEGGTPLAESVANMLFDRVNTVGTVWLGTTLECARCHTHKYDPIPQREYYQIYACFNNTADELVEEPGSLRKRTRGPTVTLPLDEAGQARHAALVQRYAEADAALKATAAGVLQRLPDWEKTAIENETVPTDVKRALRIPREKRNKGQRERVEDGFLDTQPETMATRQTLRVLARERDNAAPPTTLVTAEREQPRASFVLAGGNYLSPKEPVPPGGLGSLHPLLQDAPPNRLGLARWLVDPANPLTARVAVNRWWAEIFGHGLVPTVEDFGIRGEPPTHPALLDWLAVELAGHGWSMKHLLKLMVTSATYQQHSAAPPALRQRDPDNRLLARGPRFRLPAEAIRDHALAVSGLLDPRSGGPPVYPWQPEGMWKLILGVDDAYYLPDSGGDLWRRSLYCIWRRGSPNPSLINFDAPTRGVCTARRPRSNTPLQALNLMNDPVYLEAAFALAGRVLRERPANADADRLAHAFRLCVARPPQPAESARLEKLLASRRARYAADPTAAQTVLGGHPPTPGVSAAEFATWFSLAHVLLNLDETISKE